MAQPKDGYTCRTCSKYPKSLIEIIEFHRIGPILHKLFCKLNDLKTRLKSISHFSSVTNTFWKLNSEKQKKSIIVCYNFGFLFLSCIYKMFSPYFKRTHSQYNNRNTKKLFQVYWYVVPLFAVIIFIIYKKTIYSFCENVLKFSKLGLFFRCVWFVLSSWIVNPRCTCTHTQNTCLMAIIYNRLSKWTAKVFYNIVLSYLFLFIFLHFW